MFHISNFQCKLEFASKLNNLEKTQYINKVQHNFKNNISEVIYLSYVNSIYKMFKTLRNVCELLYQNLHNLYTNERKNQHVKKLTNPPIHFLKKLHYEQQFILHFIHQLNNTSCKVFPLISILNDVLVHRSKFQNLIKPSIVCPNTNFQYAKCSNPLRKCNHVHYACKSKNINIKFFTNMFNLYT